MMDSFESILDESISALQAGVSIEDILAEVPDYSAELRPLLYAATILTDPNPALVPEERKAALQAEYMARAAELPPVVPTLGQKLQAIFRIAGRRLTPEAVLNDLVTVSITIILTLTMTGLILTYLARDTIPGDFLYGVKRISEDIQLSLTFSRERRVLLADTFNQRRLLEIEQLLELNRVAVVEFEGNLETKAENLWIIEGLPIVLTADTQLEGDLREGDKVIIIGLLGTNNVLEADIITAVE